MTLDDMITLLQIDCVQQTLCLQREHNLDARDQQPYGLLNTCLNRCDALGLSLWNLPRLANARRGLFLLNLGCAFGRLLSVTQANDQHEVPRRMEKENVSPLDAGPPAKASGFQRCCRMFHLGKWIAPGQHSEDCGFLSPFAFFEQPPVRGLGVSFLSLFVLLSPVPLHCL